MEESKKNPTKQKSSKQKVEHPDHAQNAELEELRNALKEKEDQLLRIAAEFDNYRKRIAKEVDDIGKAGKRDLLLGLLNVSDSFERAFQSEALKADRPLYQGIMAIYRQVQQLLEQHQVMGFESVGQSFDPNLHEAVGTENHHKYLEGSIVREIQKGYLWEGRVLRPAQVLVAKPPNTHLSLDEMA